MTQRVVIPNRLNLSKNSQCKMEKKIKITIGCNGIYNNCMKYIT